MNVPATRVLLPLLAALGATACVTSGIGSGSSRANDVNATFMWQSRDDRTGTLTANLSSGETFTGQYFQITSDTRIDQIGPLWDGWRMGWRGQRYWAGGPTAAFVTHYSGRVVANLAGPGGQHMRCNFQLIRPASGMSGGGQGQCQLPSGKTIDTTFVHH
jgi:hypothetical protein